MGTAPLRASSAADHRPSGDVQMFRLYVSSASPVSSRALVNARRFFDRHLAGRYRLEIVNIADHVEQARRDQVVASPTLLRLSPLPQRRFIGDMSDTERLCDWLDVAPSVDS
jgi:circadian clock protein KaiB